MQFNFLKSRPKIGLALGGGGPKGLAHIGVIKTLEKHKIPIDYIAGTSAGSIVGAFYSASKDISSVEDYIMNKNWLQLLSILADPSLRGGIFQGKKVQAFMEGYLKKEDITFSQLKLPFSAVAVDLSNGQAVPLSHGAVIPSVVASCTIPMMFKPVLIEGKYYVDGGVTSPVPVEAVKKMGADIIVAVNLNKHYGCDCLTEKNGLNFLSVAQHSFSIMMHNIASYEVQKADLVVNPRAHHIHWKSLGSEAEKTKGIHCGEVAMEEDILSLQLLIKSKPGIIPSFLKKFGKIFK